MYFIAPDALQMPKVYIEELKEKGIKIVMAKKIEDVSKELDILYMTRIQKERLNGEEIDEEFITKNLHLTQEILTNAKNNMVIMHPLPRNNEINTNIDNDPRAAYFRQMENGLYVRMALLQLLI